MKKISLLILIFGLLLSCNKKEKNLIKTSNSSKGSEAQINIKYYSLGTNPKHLEKIYVLKINKKKIHQFVYTYKYYHEGKDSLTFYKDSVRMNGEKMIFLAVRELKTQNHKFTIFKYLISYPRTSAILYISREHGVLLTKAHSGSVTFLTEYSYDKNAEILSQIFSDKDFLNNEDGNVSN